VTDADRCDFLDAASCLLPFPSDVFTVADATTDTGRRVHLAATSMPHSRAGVGIDPAAWNAADGFSPGSAPMALVPGLDLSRTGPASVGDIGRSLRADAPIVLLDATTGQRHPYWAELDASASAGRRVLVVRPAVALAEGHRYVVALRQMKDGQGRTIPPAPAFPAYRDRQRATSPEVEARRPHTDEVLGLLGHAGVGRRDLHLAWDFTAASARSLAAPMLHMRDDAYAALGSGVPAFRVTEARDDVDPHVARRVTGTFAVPSYLTGGGGPGSRLAQGANGLPARTSTYTARFVCIVPRSAMPADGPVRPGVAVVFGHGLLGRADDVDGYDPVADATDAVMCATDWIGMASEDIPNVLAIALDGSHFPSLPDRLQQALLDFQFLARLMKDPRGFAAHPAFEAGAGRTPVVATGDVFFDGNSQGGILGGAATAISTEWTRAVLGVPGMNFSAIVPRSVDFDRFRPVLSGTYPDAVDRALVLALFQMLWDRGEADGYAAHMTDHPYPGTPAHDVLLVEAFGDHQVPNSATETEARTIGARLRQPALAPGRSPQASPFWGLDPVPPGRFDGSVLVVWDFGAPAPPPDAVPARAGTDPHGAGSAEPRLWHLASTYLRPGGAYADECAGAPCRTP